MRIVITGAKGQLAGKFQRVLRGYNYEISALEKGDLDISDLNAVTEAFSRYEPDIILNCAAYNFVDKAEEDYNIAYKVNATGVRNLAVACKKNNALLVHYSTDYIFDGKKEDLYTEEDEPYPINNYGKSKLSGERLLGNLREWRSILGESARICVTYHMKPVYEEVLRQQIAAAGDAGVHVLSQGDVLSS